MGADENTQEWIEHYLDDSLEQQEKISFEQKLNTDLVFAQEVSIAQETRQAVKLAGRQNLKSRLEGFEKEIEKNSSNNFSFFRTLGIALMIFLALGIAFWWFLQAKQKNTPAKIYAAQFEPYRNPLKLRQVAPQQSNSWLKASEYYSQQNFEKAAHAFQQVLNQNSNTAYLAHFYLGVSLLAQKPAHAEKAILAFEAVFDSDNDYHQAALWYKALAYLQLEKPAEAKSILRKIVANNSYKKEEAKYILKQINLH